MSESRAVDGHMQAANPESTTNDVERQDPACAAADDNNEKRGILKALSSLQRLSPAVAPIKTPKDTVKAVYQAGIYKAGLTMNVLCVQSFMAGLYIAVAGHMFLALGGGILGSIFFPTSGELFTGDSLVFVVSVLGGKVSIFKLLRNWTVSWIFNFAGCLVWAYVFGLSSGALEDSGRREFAIEVALKKANQPWIHIFLKGIGANLLVCLGVWQGTCAEEAAGKILGLWFPVSGFVIMGFDHVIANQFLISMGMMFGADITITHLLFRALLPATLGNIVGGGVCVGAVYWYVFDSMGSSMHIFSRIRWQPVIARQPSRYIGEESALPADSTHANSAVEESKRE
jgi:formate transporter